MSLQKATLNGVACVVDSGAPTTPVTDLTGDGGDIVAFNAAVLRSVMLATRGINAPSSSSSDITLTNPMSPFQRIIMTATGKFVILPAMNATDSLPPGSMLVIHNGSTTISFGVKLSNNVQNTTVLPGQTVFMLLRSSSATGVWQEINLMGGEHHPVFIRRQDGSVVGAGRDESYTPTSVGIALSSLLANSFTNSTLNVTSDILAVNQVGPDGKIINVKIWPGVTFRTLDAAGTGTMFTDGDSVQTIVVDAVGGYLYASTTDETLPESSAGAAIIAEAKTSGSSVIIHCRKAYYTEGGGAVGHAIDGNLSIIADEELRSCETVLVVSGEGNLYAHSPQIISTEDGSTLFVASTATGIMTVDTDLVESGEWPTDETLTVPVDIRAGGLRLRAHTVRFGGTIRTNGIGVEIANTVLSYLDVRRILCAIKFDGTAECTISNCIIDASAVNVVPITVTTNNLILENCTIIAHSSASYSITAASSKNVKVRGTLSTNKAVHSNITLTYETKTYIGAP